MTELYVEEIKLQDAELKSFITEVNSKHGDVLTLNELYSLDEKQGNEIILGRIEKIFPLVKKRERQMLLLHLCEVATGCDIQEYFRVFVFNKFATSLANVCLQKDDFVAFRSAYICENSQYYLEKGCHPLEARIGLFEQSSAKIFFARRSRISNAGISKEEHSSTNCKRLRVCPGRREIPSTFSRASTPDTVIGDLSPSLTETSYNSARISPVPSIMNNNVLPSVLPGTPPPRVPQIQHAFDTSAVAPGSQQNKYTYKKLSELVVPEMKVNIYGVIHTIIKMPKEDSKHAVVRLKDETCGPDQEFRVHIFFNHETAFPKLEHGYILRLHRLKTEVFDGVVDGRVFRTTDVVTFPPDGQGISNSFSTSKYFHFCDSDAQRLTELRRWIASQKQQQPLPANTASSPPPMTSNAALLLPISSLKPTKSLFSEIKKEGNYILHCKVLDVNKLSNEIHIYTVTDGTLFIYSFHLNEDERHATREVRILIMYPPEAQKIKKGALVELTNVTVQVIVFPESSQCDWPFLSCKMNGNNCSIKVLKGFEPEAQKLKRQLQNASLKDQQCPTDTVDLITELTSGGPLLSDNCVNVADTITHSSDQNNCQPSEISAEGEELNCQVPKKSVVERGVAKVQQRPLEEQSVFTGNAPLIRGHAGHAISSRGNKQQVVVAGSILNEKPIQDLAEEITETYTEFSDALKTESNAQYCASTHPVDDENTNPVHNTEGLEDPKIYEVESVASDIIPGSEVDSLDSGKFSALTQACLKDIGQSNSHEAETLVFIDASSDTVPADTNICGSVLRRVQRSCVQAECENNSAITSECSEKCGGSPCATVTDWTDEDEDMECNSAKMHSHTVGCKEEFATGIIPSVRGIPKDISDIKREVIQNGEKQVYLLKAWVKDIEPPINDGSNLNIVSGYCHNCKSTQIYEALVMRQKNILFCRCCFQEGQEITTALEYMLRLHLIDENGEELIATVTAHHAVQLLGCTVNAYLYDSMANRRVVKMLTGLIAESKNVSPQNRGPKMKLLVTPISTSKGIEYCVHSTYLFTIQDSEQQRNS